MAFPTAVNSQITDAVTQTNVKVVAEDPAKVQSDQAQTQTAASRVPSSGRRPIGPGRRSVRGSEAC